MKEKNDTKKVPIAQGQGVGEVGPIALRIGESTPSSSKRQALCELRRALSEKELSNPGVQKMLLDALERADTECENLQSYIQLYHDADKRAAILTEKLCTQTAFEIMFGVGVGLGGAIIGIAPLFWNQQPYGWITLIVGFLLVSGTTFSRISKK